MLDDPVKERLFKANIMTGLFALKPFVPEDFLPLREEFLVENRILNELRSIFF